MPRKVHLSIMAYGGQVPAVSLTMTLPAVMQMVQGRGWNITFHYRVGDSILPRARNAEAANFLGDPDATDLLMIDADTLCSGEDLIRLLERDADVVGAPYIARDGSGHWSSVRWRHQNIEQRDDGLIEVEGVGTGLIKISRRAMQAIWDAEPRRYRDPTAKSGESRGVFFFEIENGHLWGEDIVFCRKWRALGGQVFTDPTIRTTHVGEQHFNGHLESWLKDQPALINVEDVIGKKTIVQNLLSKHAHNVVTLPSETKSEAA